MASGLARIVRLIPRRCRNYRDTVGSGYYPAVILGCRNWVRREPAWRHGYCCRCRPF